jgi:hypothetical protein
MSAQDQQKNSPPQPEPAERTFDPVHVMSRKHYEDLARQAVNQK